MLEGLPWQEPADAMSACHQPLDAPLSLELLLTVLCEGFCPLFLVPAGYSSVRETAPGPSISRFTHPSQQPFLHLLFPCPAQKRERYGTCPDHFCVDLGMRQNSLRSAVQFLGVDRTAPAEFPGSLRGLSVKCHAFQEGVLMFW